MISEHRKSFYLAYESQSSDEVQKPSQKHEDLPLQGTGMSWSAFSLSLCSCHLFQLSWSISAACRCSLGSAQQVWLDVQNCPSGCKICLSLFPEPSQLSCSLCHLFWQGIPLSNEKPILNQYHMHIFCVSVRSWKDLFLPVCHQRMKT